MAIQANLLACSKGIKVELIHSKQCRLLYMLATHVTLFGATCGIYKRYGNIC